MNKEREMANSSLAGGYANSYPCAPQPVEAQSEVDRELDRLDAANGSLKEHVEELHRRLQKVVHQNPVTESSAGSATPICNSKFGAEINTQTDRLTDSVRALRYLIDALAI